MQALKSVWDFFQNEILGMKWLNQLIGSLLESCGLSTGLTIEVEYITDMEKIMQYGVMSMPALVVNEQVASMGKVLKSKEVETLLKKLI